MYHRIIQSIDDSVNAAGIESAMRLQYGTLDHLSRSDFAREIALLKRCEADEPGFLRGCCYGREAEFDACEGQRRIAVAPAFAAGLRTARLPTDDGAG